ncbi:MAG: 30S ribosomal protein S12 methylthiotransferase RimO [Clostridia bacterium]|nr:30S ribosomal protein S12 methylthiotransferase RimO [Clostridia bacterium]MBR0327914.1 30S ribosomal protein S12 methylthiotransferase RimO [Clostridia bacterium]
MAKVGFVSLGCSKNLVDTETMLARVAEAGYEITPEAEDADVVIINTCAFIQSAKEESIETIIDIGWLKEHHKLKGIVVCGCMAERYGEQIKDELPEVDCIVGLGSIDDIVEAVKKAEKGEKMYVHADKEQSTLGGDRVLTTGAMAYLKIAEGCDNRCTYCAIPLIRGKMRSRPMEDIVEEAKDLEKLGVKELCIIAQDTSRYGLDLYGDYKLAELIRKISSATTIPWIRLLYLYPDKITDELIEEMKNNPRVVKYADIPIQHISDNMLKAMGRHGGKEIVTSAINRLRAAIPNVTLRTTVMVGFPGETEEDFEELCDFVKKTKFDRLGAFTYSPEEDTAAAEFDDQIDEQVKQDRYDTIMQIQLEVSASRNRKLIGRKMRVLCENFDIPAEVYVGRSEADAPDVDGKVFFVSDKKIRDGQFVTVRINEAEDYDLIGEIV